MTLEIMMQEVTQFLQDNEALLIGGAIAVIGAVIIGMLFDWL